MGALLTTAREHWGTPRYQTRVPQQTPSILAGSGTVTGLGTYCDTDPCVNVARYKHHVWTGRDCARSSILVLCIVKCALICGSNGGNSI